MATAFSPGSVKKPAPEKRPSDQEIVATVNAFKQEMTQIAQKLGELEMEKEEHQLVIDTITPLSKDRKCFRLVGGVLVERTVGDVLPAVTSNTEGIQTIMKQLAARHKQKETELEAYQKKWNVKIRG
ncbi:hypothetical protein HK104_011198 [Borealophlyctis nickersoniae]|nr:hypothetical protein HK104_011198 [Borealophlyctis nickersoniae]